jgi:hypothetical protein
MRMLDDLGAADQDGLGQSFVDHHLRGAQHPLVLTFG